MRRSNLYRQYLEGKQIMKSAVYTLHMNSFLYQIVVFWATLSLCHVKKDEGG